MGNESSISYDEDGYDQYGHPYIDDRGVDVDGAFHCKCGHIGEVNKYGQCGGCQKNMYNKDIEVPKMAKESADDITEVINSNKDTTEVIDSNKNTTEVIDSKTTGAMNVSKPKNKEEDSKTTEYTPKSAVSHWIVRIIQSLTFIDYALQLSVIVVISFCFGYEAQNSCDRYHGHVLWFAIVSTVGLMFGVIHWKAIEYGTIIAIFCKVLLEDVICPSIIFNVFANGYEPNIFCRISGAISMLNLLVCFVYIWRVLTVVAPNNKKFEDTAVPICLCNCCFVIPMAVVCGLIMFGSDKDWN